MVSLSVPTSREQSRKHFQFINQTYIRMFANKSWLQEARFKRKYNSNEITRYDYIHRLDKTFLSSAENDDHRNRKNQIKKLRRFGNKISRAKANHRSGWQILFWRKNSQSVSSSVNDRKSGSASRFMMVSAQTAWFESSGNFRDTKLEAICEIKKKRTFVLVCSFHHTITKKWTEVRCSNLRYANRAVIDVDWTTGRIRTPPFNLD